MIGRITLRSPISTGSYHFAEPDAAFPGSLMALTDSNSLLAPAIPAASRPALARLSQIHAETSEAAQLLRFLHSAVAAGAGLILLGAASLVFAGGAGLAPEFAWSLLVLIGVGAMLRSYIKSTAQAFDRAPLRHCARDLRAVLFYLGFAWGAGAFLLLGDNPVPLMGLCFAVLPSALLLPLLKDRGASLNFILPVTGLTAIAILVEPWGSAALALAMLLVAQGSLACGLLLSGPRRPRADLSAGLSLR